MNKCVFLSALGVTALCCITVVAELLHFSSLSPANNATTSTPTLNTTSPSPSSLQNSSEASNNSSLSPTSPLPTILTLGLPTTAKVYQKVTISSVLTDSNHQAISGQYVYYIIIHSLGHELVGGGTTDDNGSLSTSFEFAPSGNYTVQAVFSGRSGYFPDSIYLGSKDTGVISIAPKIVSGISATTLSVFASNNRITTKSIIQLGATLKDSSGDPVPNVPIVFQFSADNVTWIPIKTVSVGVYGVAGFDYTPSQTGNLTIRAVFNGDANYCQSQSNVTLTVM